MGRHKKPVLIDYSKCAPCSGFICIGVCPEGILETGPDNKPILVDISSCTSCGVCENLCPLKAIIVNPERVFE